MTSGGNKFTNFPENQLITVYAVFSTENSTISGKLQKTTMAKEKERSGFISRSRKLI